MKTVVAFLLMLLTGLYGTATGIYPANPNIADRRCFVADPAGALSSAAVTSINRELYSLRQATTVEMGVAVVPDTGGEEIQPYAVELFSRWGLGQTDRDNGVLLVVSTGTRRAFIMTGYGVEGALPDAECSRILSAILVPAMKQGDIDTGIKNTVDAVVSVLSEPSVAGELRSATPGKVRRADGGDDSSTLFYLFIGLITILAVALFIRDALEARRKRTALERTLMWRRQMLMFWALALLSVGAALPVALLATLMYRRGRTRGLRCPRCATKMKRLNERDDDAYLTPAQQLEERIGSVDYDVWLCPSCANVERIPYRAMNSGYTECPSCHTVAMRLKSNNVIQPPGPRRGGRGERVYECLYCGHQRREPYDIPASGADSVAAAAAVGAILGSMGSRGGGFGGGMGGGFGGGSTGGGGAGAGW